MHSAPAVAALLIALASATVNTSLSEPTRPTDVWLPHSPGEKNRYVPDPKGKYYTDGFNNWYVLEGKIVEAGPYRSLANKAQLFQRDFDGSFVPIWVFPDDPRLQKTFEIAKSPVGRYALGVDGRYYERADKEGEYIAPDGTSCTKSKMNVFHLREENGMRLGAMGHMASIRGVRRR
ncbi:hypothetical protein FOL47_006813 [Perkinsus chesapeaki]|uniref:Uncharacterized protein n=1 Tax=Perkinsus chesapeaki TaxID=330153 RepID=A0A7J6MWS6_PERCH|nr:hypothetical protein FOL47_006813 [Perkinsus chesapeaki]